MKKLLAILLAFALSACANPMLDTQPKLLPTSAVLSPQFSHHYLV
jgi:uncharacterized lipoprotein YmbA